MWMGNCDEVSNVYEEFKYVVLTRIRRARLPGYNVRLKCSLGTHELLELGYSKGLEYFLDT